MASPSQNPQQSQQLAAVYENLAKYAQQNMANYEQLAGPDYARAMQAVRNVVADAYGKYGEAGTLNYVEMQRYGRIIQFKNEIDNAIRNNLKGVVPKAQKILRETATNSYKGSASIAYQSARIKLPTPTVQQIDDIINTAPGIGPGMSFVDRMMLRQSDTVVRMQKDIMRQLAKDGAPLEDAWDTIQKSMTKTYLRDLAALKDEAHRTSQKAVDATLKTAASAGYIPTKIWVTAGDERVRPAHQALDGQVKDANEPFVIGEDSPKVGSTGATEWDGYEAYAPMEFGEPALDYNCRCWVVADWRPIEETPDETDVREEAQDRHDLAVDNSNNIMGGLQQIVDPLGADLDGNYDLTKYRAKTTESIIRKMTEKIKEAKDWNQDMTVQEAADRIFDYSRFTAESPVENYTDNYYEIKESLEKLVYKLIDAENKWNESEIYHGINTQWVSPEGVQFELQFHTPAGSNYLQKTGHKLYENYRESDDPIYRANLALQMAEAWNNIERPPGVDDIPGYKPNKVT